MLSSPAIGPVLAPFHQLIGARYFVKCSSSGVAQFVVANTLQEPGGLYLGEIQEDGIPVFVPDRSPGFGSAVVDNDINVMQFAIGIKIG